jgi:hypothetical protein
MCADINTQREIGMEYYPQTLNWPGLEANSVADAARVPVARGTIPAATHS